MGSFSGPVTIWSLRSVPFIGEAGRILFPRGVLLELRLGDGSDGLGRSSTLPSMLTGLDSSPAMGGVRLSCCITGYPLGPENLLCIISGGARLWPILSEKVLLALSGLSKRKALVFDWLICSFDLEICDRLS